MRGPFYFAWVNPNETTFTSAHKREDEEVFSFNITHAEGDFASLEITITNPRIGLLGPDRKKWAWLAFNRNWKPAHREQASEESGSESESELFSDLDSASESDSDAADIVPLFFGRVVGFPTDVTEEACTLTFIARPEDFQTQKEDVAESLRVRPYWDSIWFNAETRLDPDNVLESRPALWHIDRTTHVVSVSDIVMGEDGTLNYGEDDVFYDSLSVSIGTPPLRAVRVDADVSWGQAASGTVDLTGKILAAFASAGSGNGYLIKSYTGKGLTEDWPKPGSGLGGGWSVAASSLDRLVSARGPYEQIGPQPPLHAEEGDVYGVQFAPWYQGALGQGGSFALLVMPNWNMAPQLVVQYDTNRAKSERLTFTLEADVQPVLTEPGEEDFLQVAMSSSEISTAIDLDGGTPIGDVRNRVFFTTDRGAESIEYLIAVARARLLARARTVDVEFEISFNAGVDAGLSCRKNVVLTDYRLPGRIAGGKIKSYSLSADGDSGALTCQIIIGCCVGRGNTVAPVDGDPTYCNEDYVESDYQVYTGRFVMPITGSVIYESIEGLPPNDDGIDFAHMTADNIVNSLTVSNGATAQAAMFTEKEAFIPFIEPDGSFIGGFDDPEHIFRELNLIPTTVSLSLKSVTGGPFHSIFPLTVSALMIPKTINLESEEPSDSESSSESELEEHSESASDIESDSEVFSASESASDSASESESDS